ncbi:MAG: hypothetical protein OSA24_01005 [Longimicrobiales bacterium]|nr:hypothetical protein [Longimicrobiales bacterium]
MNKDSNCQSEIDLEHITSEDFAQKRQRVVLEIGISTSKLHAFGPMGAKDLTTRKFVVHGKNHIRV